MSEDGEGWGIKSFGGLYETMPEERAFTLGFEFGQIYTLMQNGQPEIEQMINSGNRTIIDRACASSGYALTVIPSEMPEYITIKMRKTQPSRDNPHGLRVVS